MCGGQFVYVRRGDGVCVVENKRCMCGREQTVWNKGQRHERKNGYSATGGFCRAMAMY